MKETLINGKYRLVLPDHRADRPEWDIDKGGWEVERIESMLSNLRAGDLVVDIGTEEGDISALLAQKTGRIILFEPNEKVWPNIRAIWEANDLGYPVSYFVGFASNKTTIELHGHSGYSFTAQDRWPKCASGIITGDHGFKELKDSGDIPQIRIDDLIFRLPDSPKLITIDVEGSEFEVLKGAEKTISLHRPHLYVSVHPQFMADMFQQKYPELRDFVLQFGYEEVYLTYDHELHIYFKPI